MRPSELLDELSQHAHQLQGQHLRQLFAQDPHRFKHFSLSAAGLLLDYSKNRLTDNTLPYLIRLAQTLQLPEQIQALFSGKAVNTTEQRPALHTALRDLTGHPLYVNGHNIKSALHQTLEKMQQWVDRLNNGQWYGYTQKPITDVVHIGIGGSHLGPLMASEALAPYQQSLRCYFIAHIDPVELDTVLHKLNPQTTLFILASKTFTTQETLMIADRAKAWLMQAAGSQSISQHFLATTAQTKNAEAYGVSPEYVLPFADWVGGRYSTWSAIGLPIALQIGMTRFRELLAGAQAMDEHFHNAPLGANMPAILAMLGFWYIRFFKATAHAVLPYDYSLRSFPSYLQQLDMESNGKRIQKNGSPVLGHTAPVVFGEIGTNGQHSFHQLLFQGTHLIPCDFIAVLKSPTCQEESYRSTLIAHCLAQSRGLMLGKTTKEVQQELLQKGYDREQAAQLAPHKVIVGNQPSNTLLIPQLTPQRLGALMALYEHKVFVQGVLWGINSFDQWGVELGKEMARELLSNLVQHTYSETYDASTRGLLQFIYSH